MRELTKEEIEVLQRHARYIETGGEEGERANLRGASLRGADLRWANLSEASLRGADLGWANLSEANLRGADLGWANLSEASLRGASLRGADLRCADLRWANLSEASLRGASLRCADLRWANLSEADLSEADLDFSSWPLWCGSKDVKAGDRLVAQLIFHVTRLDTSQCSGGVREAIEHIRSMAVSDMFCEYRDDVSRLSD